jgi:hypothetical protein
MTKKQRLYSVMTLAIVALGMGSSLGWAQQNTFNIPFEFYLGDNVLPAGSYEIKADERSSKLKVTNTKTGDAIFAGFLSRVTTIDGTEAKLAFDKVGNKTYLCEIHYPDKEGYHLAGVRGKHTHVISAENNK